MVRVSFPSIDQPGPEAVGSRREVFFRVMDQSEIGEVRFGPVVERVTFVQQMDQPGLEAAELGQIVGPESLVRGLCHPEPRRDEARLFVWWEGNAAPKDPPEQDFDVDLIAGWKRAVALERLND